MVVVLYFVSNEQQHYLEHDNEVTAICISRAGLVSSAEHSETDPRVHIWHYRDRRRARCLSGIHRSDVYILSFVCSDRYLLSCGKREQTTVVIYSMDEDRIHYSTFVDTFIRNVMQPYTLLSDDVVERLSDMSVLYNDVFYMYDRYAVFEVQVSLCRVREMNVREAPEDIAMGPITSGMYMMMNVAKVERIYAYDRRDIGLVMLTGHSDGKLALWEYRAQGFKYTRMVHEYKYSVVQLLYVGIGVAVCTDDAIISVWDLRMMDVLYIHDMSQLTFKLNSLKIKNVAWARDKIMLDTYSGDFVSISIKPKKEMKKDSFIYSIDGKRYRNIVKLNGKLTCSLLIEKKGVGSV